MQESAAILILCLLFVFILLRSKHVGYALAVTPLAILPSAHIIISGGLYIFADKTMLGIRTEAVRGFIDLLALVVTVVCIALISRKIESSKNRKLYLFALVGYSVLLGWVYIWESLRGIIT